MGDEAPPEEQDHNDPPFPWKALHRSLTRRIGVLVDQAAHLWYSVDDLEHLRGLIAELEVLDRVHSDFHVVDDD